MSNSMVLFCGFYELDTP